MKNAMNVDEDSATDSPGHLPAANFVFTGGTSMSFRDRLIGGGNCAASLPTSDLLEANLASLTLVDGDRLRPAICFSDSVKNTLSAPYEDGLVITVLGKRVGFLALRERLQHIWKMKGRFEMIDLGYGYFLFKFDRAEDRNMVINGGPWMVFGSYLAVSIWNRSFSPKTNQIKKTLVWVRLPSLGIMYYNDAALRVIATAIGRPVKIDVNTSSVNRGKYARLCVEIDLELPVVSSVLIDGAWQCVEYEGLHLICTGCGRYGHIKKDCSSEPIIASPDLESSLSPKKDSIAEDASLNPSEGVTSPIVNQDIVHNMCPASMDKVPQQPQLGEWVVVQPRKKRGNITKKNSPSINSRVPPHDQEKGRVPPQLRPRRQQRRVSNGKSTQSLLVPRNVKEPGPSAQDVSSIGLPSSKRLRPFDVPDLPQLRNPVDEAEPPDRLVLEKATVVNMDQENLSVASISKRLQAVDTYMHEDGSL